MEEGEGLQHHARLDVTQRAASSESVELEAVEAALLRSIASMRIEVEGHAEVLDGIGDQVGEFDGVHESTLGSTRTRLTAPRQPGRPRTLRRTRSSIFEPLSTSTKRAVPPWWLTISATIARPSPVPPEWRLRAVSARTKRSKRRGPCSHVNPLAVVRDRHHRVVTVVVRVEAQFARGVAHRVVHHVADHALEHRRVTDDARRLDRDVSTCRSLMRAHPLGLLEEQVVEVDVDVTLGLDLALVVRASQKRSSISPSSRRPSRVDDVGDLAPVGVLGVVAGALDRREQRGQGLRSSWLALETNSCWNCEADSRRSSICVHGSRHPSDLVVAPGHRHPLGEVAGPRWRRPDDGSTRPAPTSSRCRARSDPPDIKSSIGKEIRRLTSSTLTLCEIAAAVDEAEDKPRSARGLDRSAHARAELAQHRLDLRRRHHPHAETARRLRVDHLVREHRRLGDRRARRPHLGARRDWSPGARRRPASPAPPVGPTTNGWPRSALGSRTISPSIWLPRLGLERMMHQADERNGGEDEHHGDRQLEDQRQAGSNRELALGGHQPSLTQ